jgi:hypothetical protein
MRFYAGVNKLRIFLKKLNEKGISIVGTVFTLLVLGVMGAALVAFVATEQESRMRSIHRERSFYAAQACFEYALRAVKTGGYPLAQSVVLGDATFSNTIGCADRRITCTGSSSEAGRVHSITTAQLPKDCININFSGVGTGGASGNEIQNIVLNKTCLDAVTVESLTLSWIPDMGERVMRIEIAGVEVYSDLNGAASGALIDISNVTVTGSAIINVIEFSSGIGGKDMTLAITTTDGCQVSGNFTVP